MIRRRAKINMPQKLPYTPPDYLNIYDLLKQVSKERFQESIQFEEFVDKKHLSPGYFSNGITEIKFSDLRDLNELEKKIHQNQFPFKLFRIDVTVSLEYNGMHTLNAKNEDITLNVENSEDANFFKAYFQTTKMTRDWLNEEKLTAYVLFNNNYQNIPKSIWMDDKNWYRLLADGQINEYIPSIDQSRSFVRGTIYFKKREVARLLKIESAVDQEKQEPDEEETLIKPILQKNLRASLRLLFIIISKELDFHTVEWNNKKISFSEFILKGKKTNLIEELKKLADLNNMTVIRNNIQSEISHKSEEELDFLEKTAMSREDIKAIATLLRSLKNQAGQQKNKK